jgi:hypothetical protein
MNLDQDIRTMLRARAEGVATAPTIPHGTVRRVRVRKTLMTGGVAAVVAALVFGGFAASRSLSNDAAPVQPADETEKGDLTTTFVSPRNGFSVRYLDEGGVAVTPAKQLWEYSKQVDDGFDVVVTGSGAVFKGVSTNEFGGSGSIDERVDEYLSAETDYRLPGGCGVPRSQQAEITIDGQSGKISECENRVEATVVAGGRLYLFLLEHDRSDARAVFDAFVATIDLHPETAVDFPGPTSTFVSPTNGYSFKRLERGALEPATRLWDPRNEQCHDERVTPAVCGFDHDVTGSGAVFDGASTPIPDGVSIDEWVDASVVKYLPVGCGVPRSQQAQITIDGHPGRILECPSAPDTDPREKIDTSTDEQIHATVVAGGRLYLFMMEHLRSDARAWFDAWLATIDLTPETAAAP